MIRIFLGILVFISAIFYLSYLNPDTLHLKLIPGSEQEIPIYTSLLILGSMVVGAFLMMSVVILRDTRKGYVEWREKSRLKKKEKIMDLYSQGVNELLSKKRDHALKDFQKILDQDPKHINALIRIGEVYRYKGVHKEAVRYHNQARSIEPDNLLVLFALAKDHRRMDNNSEAAEIYRNILKIDERNLGAFMKLRELYDKETSWEKAYSLQKGFWNLKKDEEEKKRLLYYQFMMAGKLNQEKEKDKIIKIYAELIKADKTFAAPYLALGKIHEKENNEKEALKIWKKGFKETGAIPFLDALDEHYRKQEDPGSIIKVYKEAINRFPEQPVYKFLLGKFYYRLEMIDDAIEIFEQLVHQGIHFPILRQILGDIYHRRGRIEDAILEYKESVNFIRPVSIPLTCTHCGNEEDEWSPRCNRCGKLESLSLQLGLTDTNTSMEAVI